MNIDLLYFDGCPSWKAALENLKAALSAEGLMANIRTVRVADDSEAEGQKFLGSPSFRVNGVELWDEARESYSLSCRVYSTPQGMKGVPTVEMLREKVRSFKSK